MPEVLTQSQIDQLLSELADQPETVAAVTEEKKFRPYNFRNPKKLTRDQQKVLRSIGEVFARHFASYLAGMTRTYCEVYVVSLEEHPYMEYNNALPDMQVTAVLETNLIKGAMLLDLSNSLTFALIERMFGGVIIDREPPDREFTDIEVTLMDRIVRRIVSLFEEAWTFWPDIEINVRQIETNTRFIKAIAMEDMVTTMVFSVSLNQVKGTVSCCLPCMEILPLMEAVVAAQSGGVHEDDEAAREAASESRGALMTKLQDASAEVCGVLGSTTMSMRDVLSLQPGDVIRLDQSVGTPLTITVNGRKWFHGVPGTRKNKMALRINRPYAE
jgi:flagellar motor switch protein FliM